MTQQPAGAVFKALSNTDSKQQSCQTNITVHSYIIHYVIVVVIATLCCCHTHAMTTVSSAPLTAGYCTPSSNPVMVHCLFRNVSSFSTSLNQSLNTISNHAAVSVLDISNYTVHQLTARMFHQFANLTKLVLHSNAIIDVSDTAFEGLNKLKELYLNRNQITALNSVVFSYIPNLFVLDVSGNSITSVAAKTFQSLRNLQKLDLQSNLITSLEVGAFNGLLQLRELNLKGNLLSTVGNGTFQDVTGLTHLLLSSNRLTALNSHIPRGLFNITSLDVSSNSIATISSETVSSLRKMSSLAHFNASNNPLRCDCGVKDFLVWIQNLAFASENNAPLCDFPQGLSGINVLNVSVSAVDTAAMCNSAPVISSPGHDTSTKDPNISSMDPLPYDKMLGWYTAMVLGSVLLLFLFCLVLDKIKRKYYKRLKRKLKKIEQQEKLQKEKGTGSGNEGGKSGLDTPTMLCSISVNTENDDVAESVEATESFNGKQKLMTSRERNEERQVDDNGKRSAGQDVYQPMLGGAEGGRDNITQPLIPPVEIVPGITLLEINPLCPLHGSAPQQKSSIHKAANGVTPNTAGASYVGNTVPSGDVIENNNNNKLDAAVTHRSGKTNSADNTYGQKVTTKL